MDISYDLINGVSLSREANQRVLKFKQFPKREKQILPIIMYYSPETFDDKGL